MSGLARSDGRAPGALRRVRLVRSCLRQAAGSALVRAGNTQVLVAATVEEKAPSFLRGRGHGWVTAEYGMLPGSVTERAPRNKVSGRAMEIQRLIGRSLRAVTDLSLLGERTITLDCDVLDADGGTRTAAITAAWVALREACDRLRAAGLLAADPILDTVSAISVGLVDGEILLDLCQEEDNRAQVDCNIVATGAGKLVEVQATAEHGAYTQRELSRMVALGLTGARRLARLQLRCLAAPAKPLGVILPGGVRPVVAVPATAKPAGPAFPTAAKGAGSTGKPHRGGTR
jgi:ribonuclease PH